MESWSDSAAIRQFSAFARAHNLPIQTMLDRDLLEVMQSADSVDFVPASAIVDILQVCGMRCSVSSVGSEAVSWVNFRGGYGPLSSLWEYAPNFAAMMRVARDYIHLENGALALSVTTDADEVTVDHVLTVATRYGGTEFIEASLTLTVRLARTVLGDGWSPLRVTFAHSPPADWSRLRRFFRCPISFDAEANTLSLRHDDYHRPAANRNTRMFDFLEAHLLRNQSSPQRDLVDRVEWLIAAGLQDGGMTIEQVAARMAVSVRTLQRRLMQRGQVFEALVQRVRMRIATDYFRTARPATLTQLAFRLGYSDSTGASRFLRRHFGKGVRALSAEAASSIHGA